VRERPSGPERKDSATIDADDIISYARARLAGFETPKSIVVLDELPETVGGKILKYKLREALR
jgi:acyl-CoA synthetase (AMP-forming)/AMP-acid ligase II